jgi:predicted transposase/invertase (TIGR01784 family)
MYLLFANQTKHFRRNFVFLLKFENAMAKSKKNNLDAPKIFINPFTDFGFKKIFGEEPNKDLLIDFLNQLLLEQNIQIKDLTYKKTNHLGKSTLDRSVVFDLYCENEKGEKFIVEMQKAKQTFFKDRTLFYSTFPIQEQATKGKDWDYQLKAVFAVAILDFTFDDEEKHKPIVNRVQLFDKTTQKVFYDKLSYIFVQIPNFDKTIDQLKTRLDQWLYVLKNMDRFDRIPEKIKDKIFQKVFKIAEFHNLSPTDQQAYEDSLKYYRDLKNSLDTAELDGFAKAEQLFLPQLEKERKQKEEAKIREEEAKLREEEAKLREEEAKLREEEAHQKILDLAKFLKQMGVSTDQISEKTGLSLSEIVKL